MDIQVGEYVRLESGIHNGIRKIVGRDKDDHLLIDISFCGGRWLTFTEETEIEKHSFNIIDLIEVGDYVNGERVVCFRNQDCDYDIGAEYNDYLGEYFGINKEDIKSIVTKEQFKSIEYRLEE